MNAIIVLYFAFVLRSLCRHPSTIAEGPRPVGTEIKRPPLLQLRQSRWNIGRKIYPNLFHSLTRNLHISLFPCCQTHPRAKGIISVRKEDLPTQKFSDSTGDQCEFVISFLIGNFPCQVEFGCLISFLSCFACLTVWNPPLQLQSVKIYLCSLVFSFSHSFLSWCIFALNIRANQRLLPFFQQHQPLFGMDYRLTVAPNLVGFGLTFLLSFWSVVLDSRLFF